MKKTFHAFLYAIATIGGTVALGQDTPDAVPNPERLQPPNPPGAPPRPPAPPEGPGRRFDQPSPNDAPPGEGRRPLLRRPQFDRPDSASDDNRRDESGSRGLGRRDPFGSGMMPTKSQPFLGVVTDPLEPTLSAQLGLTDGLGLIVNHVLSDSPAEKAGLQEHDILKQINDQLIADSEQLAALIRHYGKDTEVTLTIVRKGQEQKLTAKVGEHQAPERRPLRPGGFGSFPGVPAFDGNMENFQRRMDDWRRDMQDRAGTWTNRVPPPRSSADVLRDVAPGGPDVKVEQDQVRTRWNTSNARIVLKDDAGEIEVNSENGKRTMVAKDAKGETVFNGPIDTEEQRKAVPEMFRKKLESVMRMREERPADALQPRPNRERIGGGEPGPAPAPEPPSPRRAPQVQ
jgi:serine protease Do